MVKNNQLICTPVDRLHADITVPGDKSISHRALIFAALAHGKTSIQNFLPSADCLATLKALQSLNVPIQYLDETHLIVEGKGFDGFNASSEILDLGNSGTGLRLLTGVLAAQSFDSVLTGDESLRRRPMARIITPLTQMGAKITASEDKTAPLKIQGSSLHGIKYSSPIPSAQIKSCLIFAGLLAQGETSISEPELSRDHSERLLTHFNYPWQYKNTAINLVGGHTLHAREIEIPADFSAAAFFIVAAAITPQSNLILRRVGINPTRIGLIHLLSLMGAKIKFHNISSLGQEPIADIHVEYHPLTAIEVPISHVVSSIDEFPIFFIAAACAKGTTILRGAQELRVKESDRIASMAEGLQRLGISVEIFPDGVAIHGGKIQGGTVNSYQDHRVAMAFAMASTIASDKITILNPQNISTSFHNFVLICQQLGLNITTA
jgi:3-phosphoshikimate 1-carboxyvinyltransferase